MNLFIADIKYIARVPALLCTLLSPVFIALFLLYGFPLVSGLTRSDDAFLFDRYYTIIAITLITVIPLLYGILISFVHLAESVTSGVHNEPAAKDVKRHIKQRMVFSISLSFCVILPLIYLTDAVPTEGWLRSIYAAFLLSVMTALIFLFSIFSARSIKLQKIGFFVSALFLMTVPTGLLLHHPWNYFIFFSPFYWISWAWIILSPAESLMYGMISLVIAGIGMLILYRYFTRNSITG